MRSAAAQRLTSFFCCRLAPPSRHCQERRKELSKKCSKMGEDGKVAVRNIRKDILKRLDR
jgi:ribosome recycling factor